MPDREFKLMVINILTRLERRVGDLSETLNKEIKKIKKESEMKNSVTEIKNTLDGINSRLEEAVELISNLEDRVKKIHQAEQQREKNNNFTVDKPGRDHLNQVPKVNIISKGTIDIMCS